ncbi:hypothetical protein P280DRAFT_468239 [Massarina eburnea CBS 473.64]|uniref:Uncharacterized protein n=1 Tax=Massarina eburnea CBS 473.64 TaxID=1395130 RepID=A0A6A6S3L0_9PLEO|nr:hypothetical protein P280DRAFT_468239 [Massarina eburnea CBS 473.64]
MGHKRKRSTSISPFSTTSSIFSSSTPETQSPATFPIHDSAMAIDAPFQRVNAWDFSSVGRVKSSYGGSSGDWGLRTKKRIRNNRPDECIIHENTIQKLFTAQRQNPHASPIPSDTLPSPHQPTPIFEKPQKSTLHTFWKLPAPPVQAPSPLFQHARQQQQPPPPPPPHLPHCEDCDAPLHAYTDGMDMGMGMDTDMDIDGPMEGSSACQDCGRNVCGACAVVARARLCLGCATSKGNSRRWW